MAVEREFSVTLPSNPTTGYHWELAAPLAEGIVKLMDSTYQAPATGLLGAGGEEIWTFKAVGRGETVIELKYVRPWEKDVAPADRASFRVNDPLSGCGSTVYPHSSPAGRTLAGFSGLLSHRASASSSPGSNG